MSTKAILQLVDTVLAHFPPYRWDDEQEKIYTQSLVRQLGGYSEEVVRKAAEEIVVKRKNPRTPLVADIVEAVKECQYWADADKKSSELGLSDDGIDRQAHLPPEQRLWTKEGIKLAYDMLPTEMGRRAAAEGWVSAFWQHIVVHKKMPSEYEVPRLKRGSISMDDLDQYARIPGALGKSIYRAAQFRMSDAQRLAEIANGKRVPTRQEYFQEHFGGMFGIGPAASSIGAGAKP